LRGLTRIGDHRGSNKQILMRIADGEVARSKKLLYSAFSEPRLEISWILDSNLQKTFHQFTMEGYKFLAVHGFHGIYRGPKDFNLGGFPITQSTYFKKQISGYFQPPNLD